MLGLTLALVSPVSAQPYRYVDDQGVGHWVQSLHQIPDKYQALAETTVKNPSVAGPPSSSTPRTPSLARPLPEHQPRQRAPIEDEAVRRWKGQLLLEIQRLREEIRRCEGSPQGRSACRQAQQELFLLEAVLSRVTSPLGATQESPKQRYEHETRLLLVGLQYVAARLRDKESTAYEPFLSQMNAFKRDLEAFRSRHHSLIAATENRRLIDALMKASDLLIASAETWTREISPQGSVEARDAAKQERATQWDTVRRIIEEASVNATGSDG